MADAELAVRLDGAAGQRIEPCSQKSSRERRRASPLALRTNERGEVCVRLSDAVGRAAAIEWVFAGDALHLAASMKVPLVPAPVSERLSFEAPSLEIDLDQPTRRLRVLGTAALGPIRGVELSLQEGDKERRIRDVTWQSDAEGASIELQTAELGAPGPARLVATIVTTGPQTKLRAESVALRVAAVRLDAEIESVESDRASLRISATSKVGPPTSGWVEAWLDEQSIAAAPLTRGEARLQLLGLPPQAQISLRYRPEEPWWLPYEPLELTLTHRAPRETGRWPWLALIAPIGWICLRALQRPALRETPRPRRPEVPPRAKPLPPVPALAAGWSGRVIDAHDGWPIADAHVQIALPSLLSDGATASTLSDAHGAFSLPSLAAPLPEGARLRVTAELHTEVERVLPPEGRVDVSMISRRRLLLRRLVRWARSMGPPWHRSSEPTPRDVANVALRRGDEQTARWAEALESAAFGSTRVDVRLEAALRAQEPAWTRAGRTRADDVED